MTIGAIQAGRFYRFDYPKEFTTLPGYTAHAGQPVKVLRPLTEEEADGPNQGTSQLWEVEAADGWRGHAHTEELAAAESAAA